MRCLLSSAGGLTLDGEEPREAGDRHDERDEEAQPQPQEVSRGVDADRLLEDPLAEVAGHVQREQALRGNLPVVLEPDLRRREAGGTHAAGCRAAAVKGHARC